MFENDSQCVDACKRANAILDNESSTVQELSIAFDIYQNACEYLKKKYLQTKDNKYLNFFYAQLVNLATCYHISQDLDGFKKFYLELESNSIFKYMPYAERDSVYYMYADTIHEKDPIEAINVLKRMKPQLSRSFLYSRLLLANLHFSQNNLEPGACALNEMDSFLHSSELGLVVSSYEKINLKVQRHFFSGLYTQRIQPNSVSVLNAHNALLEPHQMPLIYFNSAIQVISNALNDVNASKLMTIEEMKGCLSDLKYLFLSSAEQCFKDGYFKDVIIMALNVLQCIHLQTNKKISEKLQQVRANSEEDAFLLVTCHFYIVIGIFKSLPKIDESTKFWSLKQWLNLFDESLREFQKYPNALKLNESILKEYENQLSVVRINPYFISFSHYALSSSEANQKPIDGFISPHSNVRKRLFETNRTDEDVNMDELARVVEDEVKFLGWTPNYSRSCEQQPVYLPPRPHSVPPGGHFQDHSGVLSKYGFTPRRSNSFTEK